MCCKGNRVRCLCALFPPCTSTAESRNLTIRRGSHAQTGSHFHAPHRQAVLGGFYAHRSSRNKAVLAQGG